DDLAAAVVAPARVALGILVRGHAADGFEDARPREVLRGDQLDLIPLPLELASEQLGYVGIDLSQSGGAQVLKGFLGNGHLGLLDRLRRMLLTNEAGDPRESLVRGDGAFPENARVGGEIDYRRRNPG